MEKSFRKKAKNEDSSASESQKIDQLVTEEPESEVNLTLMKSRKAFLIEYGCGLFLLGLVAVPYFNGVYLDPLIKYFSLGTAMLAFSYGEISRLFHRYKITDHKIVIIEGFIKQKKKNINYHPLAFIPDISMKQGRIQRFLNFGTVFVESGANSFEIKDVDNPHRIMELVEKLIEKTRQRE